MRAQRPFWVHQIVEYIMGIALIAAGFQDPEPVVPAAAGVLILLNAAVVSGPLGAFRLVSRAMHRWFDVMLVIGLVAAVVQPWLTVSFVGRATMALMLVPFGFLWWYTDWSTRSDRQQRRAAAGSDTAERVGRSAGRLAGKGWRAAKNRLDSNG